MEEVKIQKKETKETDLEILDAIDFKEMRLRGENKIINTPQVH